MGLFDVVKAANTTETATVVVNSSGRVRGLTMATADPVPLHSER